MIRLEISDSLAVIMLVFHFVSPKGAFMPWDSAYMIEVADLESALVPHAFKGERLFNAFHQKGPVQNWPRNASTKYIDGAQRDILQGLPIVFYGNNRTRELFQTEVPEQVQFLPTKLINDKDSAIKLNEYYVMKPLFEYDCMAFERRSLESTYSRSIKSLPYGSQPVIDRKRMDQSKDVIWMIRPATLIVSDRFADLLRQNNISGIYLIKLAIID